MAVTDLTNTIWLFNDTVDLEDAELIDFGLNFKSNNVTYDTFSFSPGRTSTFIYYSVSPDRTQAYSTSTGWANTNYKVISITGGYDVTNSHLISWLTNNATLLPSDLTGYTWVGNEPSYITTPYTNEGYYLSFTDLSNNSYSFFGIGRFDGKKSINYDLEMVLYGASWVDDSYKTIQITGGSDVTNSTLIAWLGLNGTLTVPQPAVTVYPSFNDVKLTDNTDYITLTINGVDFNLKTISETYLTLSNGDNLQDSGGNNLITTEV